MYILHTTINVPPPSDFVSFSPSELFRFFFQIGRWTEDSFSNEFQAFTRGKLISTVTINKWKNRDVIPTRYAGPFFKLIESLMEPDLAKTWVTAFETVWALHSAGRTKDRASTKSETLAFSDTIGFQHQKWINQLYAKKRPEETFSTSALYVPLQLHDVQEKSLGPQDVEDVIDLLGTTKNEADDIDWIFISGGPGSGKSMTALHIAKTLCAGDIFPIYMRGRRLSSIDMDIIDPKQPIVDAFSAKSFLKHFRASSFDKACLILDGLDEVNQGPQGSTNLLGQIISELKIEQTACAAHNKKLRILALGRDAHIQFAASQVTTCNSRHFRLLSLDGGFHSKGEVFGSIQGQDLRPDWWKKYLSATGNFSDPSLPDFLCTEYDDFSEFGLDPLLAYLLCHTALNTHQDSPFTKLPHERVNALTYARNKNEIYKTVIDRLALGVRSILDQKRFLTVLQHMALAVWHNGGGRSVSLKAIYDGIQEPETKASFQALGLSDRTTQVLPDILITAFYYRISQDAPSPERSVSEQTVIEFTHKTFSEYLVSTLIFDRFVRLISTFDKKNEFEGALEDWIALSCKGTHEPSLADFCQKEAAVRFEKLSRLNWDTALNIIQNHVHGRFFEASGLSSIRHIQHSNGLLFFIWSCLNLERQKRTGTHFSLSNKSDSFSSADLKSIQRSIGLHFESGSLAEPTLRSMTFLSPALSALHLTSADMSQLSFSLGHIENLICEDSSFAMTHWSHVKVTAGNYIRSVFQQAIFHQWRVLDTYFSGCFFQGSRFQGTTFSECRFVDTFFSQCHFSDVEFVSSQFENTIFDRCVFTQCIFPNDTNSVPTLGAHFRHCTFIDMDSALKNIPVESVENLIPQYVNDGAQSSIESTGIRTGLDKIL